MLHLMCVGFPLITHDSRFEVCLCKIVQTFPTFFLRRAQQKNFDAENFLSRKKEINFPKNLNRK